MKYTRPLWLQAYIAYERLRSEKSWRLSGVSHEQRRRIVAGNRAAAGHHRQQLLFEIAPELRTSEVIRCGLKPTFKT